MKGYMISRNKLIYIGIGTAALVLIGVGWHLYQKSFYDPDFKPNRILIDPTYHFQLTAPAGWRFLNIPNSILNYPKSAAQLVQDGRKAFCVLIPEAIDEENRQITLEDFRNAVVDAIKKENQDAVFESKEKLPSSWSERMRMVYTSTYTLLKIKWLIQLDLTKSTAYRTICWCESKDFSRNETSFKALCDSFQLSQK